MTVYRLIPSCLLLVALAGCTEGQKTNPLPRAGVTASKAEEKQAAQPEEKGPDTPKAPDRNHDNDSKDD
jgi:hypothetical protein